MTDDPVRVGICSTAHLHVGTYAPIVTSLDDAELVGVADEDADRGREFADVHGTEHLKPEALLSAVDGVVVCSTNAGHRQWAERAADAGVDVLLEKPLAPTVEDARAIVDTCEAAGVNLGVAMPLRFSQPAIKAKQALENGRLGALQSIVGTNRGQMPGDWFTDPETAGGGAVMDHTVHSVDLVHWMTGERVAEVYAETDTRFYDLPVEDVNVLSMRLADGTEYSLDGSWSRPENFDFWGDVTLSLVGTEGTVDVDCFAQTLTHVNDREEGDGIRSVYWGSNPDAGLIEDFVDAVRKDRVPETTGRDGVEAVAVVEAAYESAERGQPIDVDYRS